MNLRRIRPRVLHLEESYRVYCTLIQGDRRAILFDTGLGGQNLRPLAEQAAKDGFLVLCSHGHYDHVGGIGAFQSVLLSRADWHLLDGSAPSAALQPLEAGAEYDLGGLHACTVALPGHTRGSVGLLLREERLLLAGDALSPRLQLLGPGTAPLPVLRETLESALTLPFETYLASHYPGEIPKKQILAHLAHLDHFRREAARPVRFGELDCLRSDWRGPEGRSTFLFNRELEVELDGKP